MLSWQNKKIQKNKVNNELLLRKQAEHEANIANKKAEEEEKKKKEAEAAAKNKAEEEKA